jgi:hypothetical protein
MDYAAPGIGVLVLVLLFSDVVVTVFHPEGHGGPLFRILSRGAWRGARRLAGRRDDARRARRLALTGPLLTVLTPALWLALLVVGFAFIYWPRVLQLVEIPGLEGPAWAEAVYHSLNSASTLGLGDVRAEHMGLRWITAIQAIAGFGLVTAALSYFMAVYRELPALRTLALEVSTRLQEDDIADAIDDEDQAAEWDQWFEHVARQLIRLRHVFAQYPILHYFRPGHRDDEFIIQLGRLLELRSRLDGQGSPALERSAFRALGTAVAAYTVELHTYFVARARPGTWRDRDLDELRALHAELLDHFALR